MHRSVVKPDGSIHLGNEAYALGFKPGAVVEISLNCTGSLLLVLSDDDSQAVDVYARPLPSKRGQLAIAGERPIGNSDMLAVTD